MEEYSNYPKGSEWRKWDLHIHSPASYHWRGITLREMDAEEKVQAIEKFIQTIEKSDVAVFCLMDYWNFDWFFELRAYLEKNPGKLSKPVFPGMELRVECPVNYRLNIHCILSDELSNQELNDFKSELYIASIDKKLSDEALIKFAKTLDKSKAAKHGFDDPERLKDEKLLLLGSLTAEVTRESLKKAFLQIPLETGFVLLPYDTSDGLLKLDWSKHPAADNYFMQTASIFESRDQRNIDLFNGVKTPENEEFFENFYKTIGEKPKPCISGSDAHSFKDYGNFPSNRITWIKSDPTFEGFKQIIYEPIERVRIQTEKPLAPIKRINNIELSFGADTQIELKKLKKKQEFCFSGYNDPICLSDYFTCFIGGRGTGKSTLLNLIYKGVRPLKNITTFLEENKITVNDDQVDWSSAISIDSNTDEIEFLEQNQIEKFATDSVAFTRAIYKRILDLDLIVLQNDIETEKKKVEFQLNRIKKRKELNRTIKELDKKISDAKKIIETNETEEYKKLTKAISEGNSKYLAIKAEREKYKALIKRVGEVVLDNPEIKKDEVFSKYGEAYNEIIQTIDNVFQKWLEVDFSEDSEKEKQLLEELGKYQEDLENYLEGLGLTKENLKDITNAHINLETYRNEKNSKEIELTKVQKNIDEFSLANFYKLKEKFDKNVEKKVEKLKSVLDEVNRENPESIEKIDFAISFNQDLAMENIYYDFINEFGEYKDEKGARNPDIMSCLYSIDPSLILNSEISLNDLRLSISGTNKYNLLLEKIFEDRENYEIYKLIIADHLLDPVGNLKIEVFYRDKPIDQSSFGQKCTAVIVIMLLFGNNPILIDEPEAHLDSELIAKYLVDLVKKKKKERQIIFATHNANFVINADSELIHVLEMPDKSTLIKSTTIEDPSNKENLLKLEGGKKAFEDRRYKYNITIF